jgi:hypothetical protein
MTVKAIHGALIPGEADPKIVKLLEDYLVEAKAGRLRGVAIVAVTEDQTVSTGWRHNAEYFNLLGGVAWLQQRILGDGE